MLKIKQLIMLKIEQLFTNLTRTVWLGSTYVVIILKHCPYSVILMQHNVKLAAKEGKYVTQRQQTMSANSCSKRRLEQR